MRIEKAPFLLQKPCKFERFLLSLSMETKKKAGALALEANIPNEKKEPKRVRMVNTKAVSTPKTEKPKAMALNLDQTIKIIEDLHQKKRHRDRLDTYINRLKSFEIEIKAEELDPKSSYYTGCKLVLTDDKNTNFELKNPTLINDVVNYLSDRLGDKLGEIEAELFIPM